jgi:hypothetical protein
MKFLFTVLSTLVALAMAAPSSGTAAVDQFEKRCLGAGGMSFSWSFITASVYECCGWNIVNADDVAL